MFVEVALHFKKITDFDLGIYKDALSPLPAATPSPHLLPLVYLGVNLGVLRAVQVTDDDAVPIAVQKILTLGERVPVVYNLPLP